MSTYEAVTKTLTVYYGDQGKLITVDGASAPDVVFARIQEALDDPA